MDGTHFNTLCWNCKKYNDLGDCPWARFKQPVNGWKIKIDNTNTDKETFSQNVLECPLFVKDKSIETQNDVYCLLMEYFGFAFRTVQTHPILYAKRYQAEMIEKYGSEENIPEDIRIPKWFFFKHIDNKLSRNKEV